LLATLLCAVAVAPVQDSKPDWKPGELPPYDKKIRLVGRFDRRDPEGPRCQWSGSAIEVAFDGYGVDFLLDEKGGDFWSVNLDGKPVQVAELKNGSNTISVRATKGFHEVRIVKRTEAFVGVTQLKGVQPAGMSKLLGMRGKGRMIEFIGDSITCGYGNEGKNERERFTPATENADMSYAWVAARAVNADPTIIAWSGRKMWPDNTMPEIYDLALPTDPSSTWDFKGPKPQVIVINLATNDFSRDVPDATAWPAAYADFIGRLRKHYPKAIVYCATGSMMNDTWPPNRTDLTTVKGYLDQVVKLRAAKGDRRVKRIDFPPQDGATDGLGSDYHPSVATDQRMGALLAKTLRRDLGW